MKAIFSSRLAIWIVLALFLGSTFPVSLLSQQRNRPPPQKPASSGSMWGASSKPSRSFQVTPSKPLLGTAPSRSIASTGVSKTGKPSKLYQVNRTSFSGEQKSGAGGSGNSGRKSRSQRVRISKSEPNANSLNSPKLTWGYSVREKGTGRILKFGETTRGQKRYTAKYLEERNAIIVVEAKGTKRQMHFWQNEQITAYQLANKGGNPKNKDRPPDNKSNW